MIHQTGPLASGPLSALAPRMAMTNVIKPKGGNWLNNGVENSLASLNKYGAPTAEDKAWVVKHRADWEAKPPSEERTRALRAIDDDIATNSRNEALNNWVNRNLTNYVKKEMATSEDPVRKLAEQGVTHFPVAEDPRYWARKGETARENLGGTQMGQSNAAQQWENRTDAMISKDTAQEHQDMMHLSPGLYSNKDEWIKKLPPETPLFSKNDRAFSTLDLGFDHIMDVLREDLQAGRIRPEQLNKVSMEQAVRRTYEYDQELAAKMNASRAAAREGLPTYKEYPEGYKWIELNKPGSFAQESEAMGHSVRGYEPPQGHPDWTEGSGDSGSSGYGHGGWEAIKSGKAKVYSLIDPKGAPHATVEVKHPREISDELRYKHKDKINDRMSDYFMDNPDATHEEAMQSVLAGMKNDFPPSITQIKGKQNRAPNEEYLPYVQDFVKSGNWSDVGDLGNTGLRDIEKKSELKKYLEGKGAKFQRFVPEEEYKKYEDDFLMDRLYPKDDARYAPPEGMKRGGKVNIEQEYKFKKFRK
jgi:hypothetical protein